jgi:hypothetical protein
MSHYENLCSKKLHNLPTNVLKQLICNYIATILRKYKELKNRMSCQKKLELYYDCTLVPRWTCIQMIVYIVYIVLVNHVWLW